MLGIGLRAVPWCNWLRFVRSGIRNSGGNRRFQRFDNDCAKRLADLHSRSLI